MKNYNVFEKPRVYYVNAVSRLKIEDRLTTYDVVSMVGLDNDTVNKIKDLQKRKARLEEIIGEKERMRARRVKLRSVTDLPSWLFLLLFNIWLFSIAIFGKITLGTAQMLYNATTNFQLYIEQLIGDFLNIYENYLYMVDLVWVLGLNSKEVEGKLIPERPLKKGVEFKNVWFRYPKMRNWTLKDVSFSIETDENIAIVGENGAGKTTLIKLLCGFYFPERGEILVNGRNIKDYPMIPHINIKIPFPASTPCAFSKSML